MAPIAVDNSRVLAAQQHSVTASKNTAQAEGSGDEEGEVYDLGL
jgi:hypothetical protein